MLVGCYYRCPIVVEEGDRDHPRFYVLAQLVEYNEIADAVKVEMHDLLGSRQYYGDLFQHNVLDEAQLCLVPLNPIPRTNHIGIGLNFQTESMSKSAKQNLSLITRR